MPLGFLHAALWLTSTCDKPPRLLSSHTHCEPVVLRCAQIAHRMDGKAMEVARKYRERLIAKLVEVIRRACETSVPAEMFLGRSHADFATNRRLPQDGRILLRPNPDGPVDHSVPVLAVKGKGGRLLAVLFTYACHNTTLGGSFYKYNGDYAGFAQIELERAHPGAMAMFMAGCGADANPEPRGTVELAQQHGRSLAAAVETALRGDLQRLHGPLRSAMTRVELELVDPPDRETLQQWASAENIDRCRLGRYLLRRLDEDGKLPTGYRCPVQVIWSGHDLACIPCSTGYRPLNKARFLRDALHSRAYLRVYGKETIEAWDERNACPANGKLCEEAVWFMQKLLLGSRTDMEQIAEAIRKIRKHAALLARA